jgi:hypothetical protein
MKCQTLHHLVSGKKLATISKEYGRKSRAGTKITKIKKIVNPQLKMKCGIFA